LKINATGYLCAAQQTVSMRGRRGFVDIVQPSVLLLVFCR